MSVSDYIEYCFQTAHNQLSFFSCADKTFLFEKFSEEEVLKEFITFIRKKYRFSLTEWKPMREEYPRYMFLNGDKGILAYVDLKYIESNSDFSDSLFSTDVSLLLKTLQSAESRLDRPVFFVYLLNCRNKCGVYFETNEQIKDRMFRKPCKSEYYFPVFDEMGDLNNLVRLWNDLKKNNVRT